MFQLHTHISPRKGRTLRPVADVIILILAVPVLLIALVSIVVYYAVYSLLNLFADKTAPEEEAAFREEVILLDKNGLVITLVEDITDEQLTIANDNWASSVYGGDTNLYRVKTDPVITGLHSSICCFFLLEIGEFCLLQQVKDDDTKLIAVNPATRELTDLGSAGKFYLYRDEKVSTRIRGLNYSDEIVIDLVNAAD